MVDCRSALLHGWRTAMVTSVGGESRAPSSAEKSVAGTLRQVALAPVLWRATPAESSAFQSPPTIESSARGMALMAVAVRATRSRHSAANICSQRSRPLPAISCRPTKT